MKKEIDSIIEKQVEKMKNDPCWKNYKMIGTKKKNGKEVPNCVPEEVELDEGIAIVKHDYVTHFEKEHPTAKLIPANTVSSGHDKGMLHTHSYKEEKPNGGHTIHQINHYVNNDGSEKIEHQTLSKDSSKDKYYKTNTKKITEDVIESMVDEAIRRLGVIGKIQTGKMSTDKTLLKKPVQTPVEVKKPAIKEEAEKQTHRVAVTVSDPNNSAVSKRKETLYKIVKLKALNKVEAMKQAKAFYMKKGYKVHETLHLNVVNE